MRPVIPKLLALLPLAACRDEAGVVMSEDDTSTTASSSGSSSGGTQTEDSSSGSSTTGPMPCVGNEDCTNAAAPFCEPGSGECVACDGTEDPDGACAGVDPGLPVCVAGACVACTPEKPAVCTGTTPICDGGTNTCVPCTGHEQCGGAACNLFVGACLPADAVVHVGGPKEDFATLGAAVASFGAEEEGTIVVHPGMPVYNEAITVDGGRTIALLAAELGPGIVPPRWAQTSNAMPQLTVEAGSTVLVDGLEVAGNPSSAVPGVLANGGQLWLDRSRVFTNYGGGIVAQDGAELVVRNCFVGGGGGGHPALTLDDATGTVTYATLSNSAVAPTPALECLVAASLSLRNSIVVTEGGMPGVELTCAAASVTYSATELMVAGDGNVELGAFPDGMPELWFVGLSTGDFHIQNQGLFLFPGVAQWQAGDPPTDIDGDPRPTVDGTPDYAGADVPQ